MKKQKTSRTCSDYLHRKESSLKIAGACRQRNLRPSSLLFQNHIDERESDVMF